MTLLQVNQSLLTPNWLGKVEKVSQEVVSYFGENGFGMKLDSFHSIIFMSYPHYFPIQCFGSDFKTGGKALRFDN